ncbi:hypothetical protein C0J52_12797 [Blattella germanica]|nr:hypothetical protein C0J52_12797 [Blattella germanica]
MSQIHKAHQHKFHSSVASWMQTTTQVMREGILCFILLATLVACDGAPYVQEVVRITRRVYVPTVEGNVPAIRVQTIRTINQGAPLRTVSVRRLVPTHVQPIRTIVRRIEPIRVDPIRVNRIRVDPIRANRIRVDPIRVPSVRVQPIGVGK